MSLIDWLITLIPTAIVMWVGWHCRRYITGVSDFMVAGRVCGRYVISTANMANALGLVTLISFVEVHYRTGFALTFWSSLSLPLGIMLSLSGWCLYRFRETKAMSIGQFLEMRYSRGLRIFASFLRSIAEMMANIIMPALAARFFITYLDLPQILHIGNFEIPTFMIIVFVTLVLAISLICMGGILTIIVTDTIQGLICFPLLITFIVFVLVKFSWSNEIVQVISDPVSGGSFLNAYDISELRDFNIFMLIVQFIAMGMHTASGVTGGSNAAKNAHEGKMASILGTWRAAFTTVFYVVIAIAIITLMNHRNFSDDAKIIRGNISEKIVEELVKVPEKQKEMIAAFKAIPVDNHIIGKDAPLSQTDNPDEIYFKVAQQQFGLDGAGSSKTQQFKTMFRQLLLPITMRHMLPRGMVGLFCLMIILFIISTDDSRIYSASSTLVQDCVVPFFKNETLTPELHIKLIRWISIGVGVFFFLGSYFMKQLDYISLFISVMYGMWMGGCGPMIVFGFYSRFGTTAAAWTSLLSGMMVNFSGILLQRNWADHIYPFLERNGWVEPVGRFLETVSGPFNPYVEWQMNRLKFPINSYEIYFIAMMISLTMYLVVSGLTYRRPFNLERMLHRGKYSLGEVKNIHSAWTWKSVWNKLIGITPEYTLGDRVIAWSVFSYTVIYKFIIIFVIVAIWNSFSKWPIEWWGNYFLCVSLIIPAIAAAVTTVWFGIGSVRDLRNLFRDLANRIANPLDNGMVEGHMSIDDKAKLEAVDKNATQANKN